MNARRNAPMATTRSELLMPMVLSFVSIASSSFRSDITTSLLSGFGEVLTPGQPVRCIAAHNVN
jgi:hypothetical protein